MSLVNFSIHGARQSSLSHFKLSKLRKVMGATRDDFIKYPRTPHLFGSKGTDDDKHLGRQESEAFLADPSLIVEEKVDGTNVGIHFTSPGGWCCNVAGTKSPRECIRN